MKKTGKLWRRVSACVLAVSMLCSMAVPASAEAESSRRGNVNYVSNQGELLETPLVQLPLGAVKARDWLENQLLLQKDNLTGNMKKFNNYNYETSEWLNHQSGDNWEKGTYFFRGLVALAYALDDAALKEEAQQWVEAILSSQTESGAFGPTSSLGNWWSRMPALMGMRDYYEATVHQGNPDERVLPFFEKYYRYQAKELPNRPLSDWGDARGGDNLECVFWFYNQVYDPADPEASQWLLDLGTLLYEQTWDWQDKCNNTTIREHVVNTTQGIKAPPVYYQLSGDEADKVAYRNGIFNYSVDHGRIDNQPNADERARDNRSTRGNETCSVVEGLLTAEISERIFGDVWTADHMERLAYNSLPACFTPDFSGQCYYQLQNQVISTVGYHEFDCDHGDDIAYGAPAGYECCFPNCHMGWPKFVQNMWMATEDNGLALVAYGPNSVTAKVADGKTAQFVQETDYPFKDAIHLTYNGETAEFELKLRIPEWCEAPEVSVNGEEQEGVITGEYYTIKRDWQAGDEVDVRLPSELETSTWYNDSVAVEKGPLIFSLKIEEDWRTEDSNDARDIQQAHQEQSPLREIYPASRWNYGLIVNRENPAESFELVEAEDVALQPFSVDNAPVILKGKGQIIPSWTLDGNIAGPQPFGPTPYDESLVEDIELIPYGCGRLRVTHFPKIGEPSDTIIKTADVDAKEVTVHGTTYQEFDNVVVPAARDYTLEIRGEGTGSVIINGKYSQEIDLSSGPATIENLKGLIPGDLRFDAGQYNNIRLVDARADQIEVIPIRRTVDTIKIVHTKRSDDVVKVITNLDPQETPFRVEYGTQEGVYTNTVTGFETGTITLSGIDPEETCFVRIAAVIKGEEVTAECAVEPGSEDILKPNPDVPQASYTGFGTVEDTERDWLLYDPEGLVEIQETPDNRSQIHFGVGERVKAVLDLEEAYDWSDYVAEAQVTIDKNEYRDVGLIFRGTKFGNNADEYYGYYAGIGKNGIVIGYADGGWNQLAGIPRDFQAGQTYTIKVVARDEYFAVYVDDELVYRFHDSRYAVGTVGFRSWKEAFTANGVQVRPVTEEDLKVFEDFVDQDDQPDSEYPPYVEANFSDDFSDVDASNAAWTKHGATDKIQISDGLLHFGSDGDVKAMAGDDTWSDYVVKADITLTQDNTQNAGIIFRSTNEGAGANNFHGYYFGIGHNYWIMGYGDGNWYQLAREEGFDFKVGEPHTLQVVAWHDTFQFYIDGELVYRWADANSRYQTGKIGMRSYQRSFDVDNVLVRPLSAEELEEMQKPTVLDVDVTSAYNTLMAYYPLNSGANSYKVLYGTEPGVYTHEETNIAHHPSHAKDKVAFTVPEAGTYYVKFVALKDNTVIANSEELEITTDFRADTTEDREKLVDVLAQAKAVDTSNFTETSLARLERAIADAEALPEDASQMAVCIARSILYAAMTTPNSPDFPNEPEVPSEHTLTVTFPKSVELSIDGESQTIANLLGKYSANVMADTELNLTFAPSVEGREIAGVTVNGEAIAEDSFDAAGYVYSEAMPNADTTIELGFTVVDKQILRTTIEIAEGRADEAAEAVPSVKEKYEAALQAAKDVEAKKTATQDEINTAWSDLIDALHYLSFVAGDKSQLEIPMEIAESINRDLFTPDSLAALDEAYAAAADLMDDEEVLEADITAAVDALYDAIYGLVFRADISELEALVTKGDSIVANADQYIQNDAWTSFETSLEEAKTVLANENATQDAVDTAVKDLTAAISALRMIPNKDALEALIGEAEAINTNKYTAKSVATMKAALSTAKAVLNDDQATEEEVADAVEVLENSIDGLVEKSTSTSSKNSGSTSANVGNAYGAAGVVSASQSVAANAYVVSDTTVNFTLKRGSAYCFKMTVVNGNAMAPSFTAGNGDVLRTQFVAKVGNDYYYRVYATGTPGQSTGVYTTLPGQNATKHCTVTIG